MAELDKVLSEINKLPKPTNYSSLYLLAQQAFEKGFRGMTVNELVVYLSKNLPDDLTRSEFIYEEYPSGSSLPDPGREASLFLGAGTYTTPGGSLELTENFNIVGWNGEDWEKVLEVPIEVVPPDNKIPTWEAGTYVQGDQRIHNGQIWSVAVPETTEEPGTGTDWIADIDNIKEVGSNLLVETDKYIVSMGLYMQANGSSILGTTPSNGIILSFSIKPGYYWKVLREVVKGDRFRYVYSTLAPAVGVSTFGGNYTDGYNDNALEISDQAPKDANYVIVEINSRNEAGAPIPDPLVSSVMITKPTAEIVESVEKVSNNVDEIGKQFLAETGDYALLPKLYLQSNGSSILTTSDSNSLLFYMPVVPYGFWKVTRQEIKGDRFRFVYSTLPPAVGVATFGGNYTDGYNDEALEIGGQAPKDANYVIIEINSRNEGGSPIEEPLGLEVYRATTMAEIAPAIIEVPKLSKGAALTTAVVGDDLTRLATVKRGAYLNPSGDEVVASTLYGADIPVFGGLKVLYNLRSAAAFRVHIFDKDDKIIKTVPIHNLQPRVIQIPKRGVRLNYSGYIVDLDSDIGDITVIETATKGSGIVDIKSKIQDDVLPDGIERMPNGVLKIPIPSMPTEQARIVFDFKFNEDINKGDIEQRVKFFDIENIKKSDGTRAAFWAYYRKQKAGEFWLNPLKIHNLSVGDDCLYPLPYHNTGFGFGSHVYPSTVLINNEVNFAKRNLREYQPLSGHDVFSLQYLGSMKVDDTINVDDLSYQDELITNQNWTMVISSSNITISNVDLSVNIILPFSVYQTVTDLTKEIERLTRPGNELEAFDIEVYGTGYTGHESSGEAISRPSTDLLECSIKFINQYPKDEIPNYRWDAYRSYIPFGRDEEWHTCEVLLTPDNFGRVRIDGQYEYATDYVWGGWDSGTSRQYSHNVLAQDGGYIYIGGGLNDDTKEIDNANIDVKNLEVNFGHLGDASVDIYHKITSNRSPHVIGFMLHPIVVGKAVGRVTRWDDIPAENRVTFNYFGSNLPVIWNNTINQSTIVDNGDGTVSATTFNGMDITGTLVSDGIKLTEEPEGWSTRLTYGTAPLNPLYYGMEIRDEVFPMTTGDVERVLETMYDRGYKHVTFQNILDWKNGKFDMPKKAFYILSDDYHDYQYGDRRIRKVFDKYDVKFSTCIALYNLPFREGQAYRDEETRLTEVCRRMQQHGWEPMMHGINHDGFTTRDSKSSRVAIEESQKWSEEFNIISSMWSQGNSRSTPISCKMMQHAGINLYVAATNIWMNKANSKFFVPRTAIYFQDLDKYLGEGL